MTYTSVRYSTYREYLASDLGSDGSFRLLSNGEVVELPPEDEENIRVATELLFVLGQFVTPRTLVRTASTEIQVHPVGDGRVNRQPDVVVLRPAHIGLMAALKKSAVLLEMPAPAFVAEVVSPGSKRSDNYRRDYEWKRQQYQDLEIPEYWIIARHRQQVTVLILEGGVYIESSYQANESVCSEVFPRLRLTAAQMLSAGDV
ncbi:Uma2 family endonuclease [Leptolyngbya sp. BC1307]|uniref:Uma2 family endonuclease n=1 Tax=Leptolyngbya sp. BC1307 TaxID=2029589 RepID=UPI00148240C2|nr:Uma2 family endonuclease [Leptolyngbya sp. BC1307]